MASILDRYGIKEVADVTFYDIDNDGNPTVPVLYFDTLKVSTTEQTAENTSARGGKGNPELILWDYNKEITLNLEDALFSMKSLAIMYGSNAKVAAADEKITIRKTFKPGDVKRVASGAITLEKDGDDYTIEATKCKYYLDGAEVAEKPSTLTGWDYVIVEVETQSGAIEVEISPATFPGTYYITGDTFARSEANSKDEFFQFVVPKGKILSENTLTMEAEGDPSTFSMNVKVLRPKTGGMMKLIKYNIDDIATKVGA